MAEKLSMNGNRSRASPETAILVPCRWTAVCLGITSTLGLEEGFLAREYKRALKGKLSPPCGKPYHAKVHHTNRGRGLGRRA